MFHKKFKVIGRLLGYIGALAMSIMVVLMSVDVALSKFFDRPIQGTYEIVTFLMLVTVAAAFAYTQAQDGHVSVTMFTDYLPKRVQQFLKGVCLLISAAVVFILSYASLQEGIKPMGHNLQTSVLYIPYYPFYFFLVLGFFVFGLLLLSDAVYTFWLLSQPLSANEDNSVPIGAD